VDESASVTQTCELFMVHLGEDAMGLTTFSSHSVVCRQIQSRLKSLKHRRAAHASVQIQAARVEHNERFGEQMEEAVRWQGCVTSGLELA
jgi:hypothetical protein